MIGAMVPTVRTATLWLTTKASHRPSNARTGVVELLPGRAAVAWAVSRAVAVAVTVAGPVREQEYSAKSQR